jgi:hypothetical protein
VVVSADFFIAVAHMTVIFQAIKSFDLRDSWDHLQVYFMSLLQLIMAAELTSSIAVGAIFVAFLVAMLTAMVLSHFMKEGTLRRVRPARPVAVITVCSLLLTTVFFVAMPRFKGQVLGRKLAAKHKSVGFSDRVEFDSFGRVLDDPTVVMRVELSGGRLPLYWRGLTYDYFDGTSWRDTIKERRFVYGSGGRYVVGQGRQEDFSLQRVFSEPLDTTVLFGLGRMAELELAGRHILMDEAGGLSLPEKSGRRFSYTVRSLPFEGAQGGNPKYLQLPEGMEETASLARRVTASAGTERERAVSYAASVARVMLLEGFFVRLVSSDGEIPFGSGPEHLFRILDHLAVIREKDSDSYPEVEGAPTILVLKSRGSALRQVAADVVVYAGDL